MKKTIIDPPEGWKYGFPKALPEGVNLGDDSQLEGYLRASGYPESYMELAKKYSRYWEMEVTEGDL